MNLACSLFFFLHKPISCLAILLQVGNCPNYHSQTMGKTMSYPPIALFAGYNTLQVVLSLCPFLVGARCFMQNALGGHLHANGKWHIIHIHIDVMLAVNEDEKEEIQRATVQKCKCKTTRNPCIYFNYHSKRPFDLLFVRTFCTPKSFAQHFKSWGEVNVFHINYVCMCVCIRNEWCFLAFHISFSAHLLPYRMACIIYKILIRWKNASLRTQIGWCAGCWCGIDASAFFLFTFCSCFVFLLRAVTL